MMKKLLMKDIPGFSIELSQATDYILGSPLAARALEEPPFRNYVNILIALIQSVDRLADNCHLPEFTNHAVPHICGIIKSASDWAVSDGWLERISPKEAACLLAALIVHDIGMLSQDVADIPEAKKMNYMKGLSDISNWVRRTHVIRIRSLVKRLLEEYLSEDREINVYLDVIAGMAESHAKWPWDEQFVSGKDAITEAGLEEERVAALNAVIAVCDLLDEDFSRCDTITLIRHRHGSVENMAHWIRHALTVKVEGVKKREVRVTLRRLVPSEEEHEMLYRTLRNHYRLVKLYDEALQGLEIKIQRVEFLPGDGVPDLEDEVTEQLKLWQNIPEFRNHLTEQLMATFMAEARNCDGGNPDLRHRLDRIGLEAVDDRPFRSFLNPDDMMLREDKIIQGKGPLADRISYGYSLAEKAYLDGEMGRLGHVCVSVLESLEESISLNEVYWALTYLMICARSSSAFYIARHLYENSLEPPVARMPSPKITAEGAYRQLLDALFMFMEPQISPDDLVRYQEHILRTECSGLKNDMATSLLIQTVIGLFWYYNQEGSQWKIISDYFTDELKAEMPDFSASISAVKQRLELQYRIFHMPGEVTEEELRECGQPALAASWIHFYSAQWKKAASDIPEMVRAAERNADFLCSVQGYINLTDTILRYNEFLGEPSKYVYCGRYRYQRFSMEQPLAIFWKSREDYIEQLLAQSAQNPGETASERLEALRLIPLRQIDALRYWNLGEYIESIRNEAKIKYSLAVYFDRRGDYRGQSEMLPLCIITAIQAMDQKLFSEDQKKRLVALMQRFEPGGVGQVLDYITEESSRQEWSFAIKWLERLAVYMNQEQAARTVDWIVLYDTFISGQKHHFDLQEYEFLAELLEKLEKGSWDKLSSIIARVFQNEHFFRINRKLCKKILEVAPAERCIPLLDKVAEYEDNEWKYCTVYDLCVGAGRKRGDMKEAYEAFLQKCRRRKECGMYADAYRLMGISKLTELTEIDVEKISQVLEAGLGWLEERGAEGGYHSETLREVQDAFLNQNWSLAPVKEVTGIIMRICGVIERGLDVLHVYYLGELLNLLRRICEMGTPEEKGLILEYIMKWYIRKPDTAVESGIVDGPLHTARLDFGEDAYPDRYVMRLLVSSVESIPLEYQEECILWSMGHLNDGIPDTYFYVTVLCSYFYFMGDSEVKNTAFSGLMLIRGRLESDRRDDPQPLFYVVQGMDVLEKSDKWFGTECFRKMEEADQLYHELFTNVLLRCKCLSVDPSVVKWRQEQGREKWSGEL